MRYPAEAFLDAAPPRLMGSEIECNPPTLPPEEHEWKDHLIRGSKVFKDGKLSLLTRPSFNKTNGLWLPTGGRLYCDENRLLEVASAECIDAREVALQEALGLYAVRTLVQEYCALRGESPAISARTGRSTPNGNINVGPTSGYHENYYAHLPEVYEYERNDTYTQCLLSYLATRSIWAGSGVMKKAGYRTSQRESQVLFQPYISEKESKFSSFHMRTVDGMKPPFIPQRIRGQKMGRLEIRSGEFSTSEDCTARMFAMTSLVLRMIEKGRFPGKLFLEDPETTYHVSTDYSEQSYLADGTLLTAAEHQQRIAGAAIEFAKSFTDIPREEIDAARYVYETCSNIHEFITHPDRVPEEIISIEWARKLLSIQERIGVIAVNSLEGGLLRTAALHDANWENLLSPSANYDFIRRIDAAGTAIESYVLPETRARLRTSLLSAATGSIDWDYLIHRTEGPIVMDDPYEYDEVA